MFRGSKCTGRPGMFRNMGVTEKQFLYKLPVYKTPDLTKYKLHFSQLSLFFFSEIL
jgi:hypothetical protein